MNRKVILIVLDSVGIGALPDAASYNDVGCNTVGHIASGYPGFQVPELVRLGLGNIDGNLNLPAAETPEGSYGRAMEQSPGKDTTTGHWEISGIILQQPFPVYPEGFPPEIVTQLEEATGTRFLCNLPYSGTQVIDDYGEEHMKTGYPILYTSADSVMQIAAHESVVPLQRLYEICEAARKVMTGKHAVGRIIARPFTGSPGNFSRTANRKDFSLKPTGNTLLKQVQKAGLEVMAVGKIYDIFAGDGITRHVKTANNMEGVDHTLKFMRSDQPGLIFTNLVDFDMLYGHRRDVEGYARALMEFDSRVPELRAALGENDILIITADHGNDPTFKGSDHTREFIPILITGNPVKPGVNLGTRQSFADIGATIAGMLGVDPPDYGESFWELIAR